MPAAGFPEQIKKIFTFERTFLLILVIAFVIRFAFLDLKLFHHDESIHAWFSFDLLTKGAWTYDPSYHGPFLYFVTAGMFALFGASDLVGRLLPAFFGFLLIPLVWCIYRLGYLSKTQTLVAALFLAVSPDMVYFSRFLRHDIFMLAFTLMLVVAILAYFERKQTRYAILAAVAAAGSLCCKEEMPVIIIIIGLFFAIALYQKRFVLPPQWKTDLLLFIVLVAGIMGVLYTGFLGHPETLTGQNFNVTTSGWYQAIEHWSAMHQQQRLGGPWFFYLPLYLLYELPIFILAVIAAFQFLIPVDRIRIAGKKVRNLIREGSSALSTADLATESIRQLAVARQEPDKTDEFIRFCIWWMILTMAFYAWVGEKVPWLIIHQLLPMIFVATYKFNRWKAAIALLGTIFLVAMTWHVAFVPLDINEPIVQVQNSEDMRVVMNLMDHADGIVLASESYWPLPWYYRGDRWNEMITFYGKKIELPALTTTDPDIIILHDTDSYDAIEGYKKTTYKLCYWFSYYDNEDRLLEYYIHRDGKMGSINIDVFVKDNSTLSSLVKTAA